jgi:succinate-semialdehyde dehydrogenase/glutarate-semialdehyde dehydrogenase
MRTFDVFKSTNPATGETFAEHAPDSPAAVDAKLETAARAFVDWRKRPVKDRAKLLSAVAARLDEERDALAEGLTREMGKTLAAARAEVEKCALACRYYAETAEAHLADEPIATEAAASYVRHLPLGPVLAVMPWNFPFWQVFRFAAPAVAAGNVGLLKHASNVMGAAREIERVFRDAGAPEGVFQTLLIGSPEVEGVIRDPRVAAVTLTGSEKAGAAVARVAGDALKPSVLELGGSDPFIVMPSADVEKAAAAAVTARMINNGQSCIAAKRFFVHADVYDRFRDAFADRIAKLATGDPMKPKTDVGPLATRQIREGVDDQVKDSIAAGARALVEPKVIDGPGFFYRPGLLEEPPAGAPAADDEVFGPVAALFRVKSLENAIARANASRYGLGSALWTREKVDVRAAVAGLEAGATFVNAIVASDPRLPFGGVKASGYGRELGRDGVRAFVNRKAVSVVGLES